MDASTGNGNAARVGELIAELLLALGFLPAPSTPEPTLPEGAEPLVDRFTTVKVAAEALRVSSSYLYKRKGELSFMVQLPGGTGGSR